MNYIVNLYYLFHLYNIYNIFVESILETKKTSNKNVD